MPPGSIKQATRKAAKTGSARRVRIDHLGTQGDGIARLDDDTAVYVPFTAPGDEADIWLEAGPRGTMRATLEAIVKEGPDREPAACRHFTQCGGCSLQHLSDKAYALWANERIRTALSHQGFDDVKIAPAVVSPPASRRRLSLKAVRTSKDVILGFNKKQSHHLIDVRDCPIALTRHVALFKPLRNLLRQILSLRQTASIQITQAANGTDLVIEAPLSLDLAKREALAHFAEAYDLAALHMRIDGFNDPIAIRRQPIMDFAGIKVPLPPGAFIQATDEGESALTKCVTRWCKDAGRCADLFAGIGTFTFPLARISHVDAVEGVKSAIAAIEEGTTRANGLKSISTQHRDLFRRPLTTAELSAYDAVVIDPPRAGAQAQMAELAKSDVPVIAAISCNPNTFARDARLLVDGGYRLMEIHPIDQFLWSPHVELAALFLKG